MRFRKIGIHIGLLGLFFLVFAVSGCTKSGIKTAMHTELGVPAYPGWMEKRKDERGDPTTGVYWYKYEYYSDDPAERIVSYYEDQTGREAARNPVTGIYTITGREGVMINVVGSEEGVPQMDRANQKLVKKWRSLITIMKTEQAH